MERGRVVGLILVHVLVLGVCTVRLAQLQLVRGDEYARRARENRRRVDLLRAPRGSVLDRRGRPLARDRSIWDVRIVPADLDPAGATALLVARHTGLPVARLRRRLAAIAGAPGDGDREEALVRGLSPGVRSSLAADVRTLDGVRLTPADRPGPGTCHVRRETARRARRAVERLADAGSDLDLQGTLADAFDRAGEADDPLAVLREPVDLARGLGLEAVAPLAEAGLPGVRVVSRPVRTHPAGERAAHVVGYLGALRSDEVEELESTGAIRPWAWRPEPGAFRSVRDRLRFRDDRVGRTGVEALLEDRLRGTPGARWTERDRRGRLLREVLEIPPRPGRSVRLTLDLDVQEATEEALDDAVRRHGTEEGGGAAVLLDVDTGDLLSLASAPRYEPGRIHATYGRLREQRPSPLLHRAVGAAVPPGSTLKIVTAAGLLEERPVLDGEPFGPDDRRICRGYLHRRGIFECWNPHGHGRVDVVRALCVSCNILFYEAGEALGPERLVSWGRTFGLGRPTGVGLGETGGLLPTPAWRRSRAERAAASFERVRAEEVRAIGASVFRPGAIGEVGRAAGHLRRAAGWARRTERASAWTPGTSRNVAIGQGEVRATPIQIARVAAAVAGGGRMPVPRLVREAEPTLEELDLSEATLTRIREGMRRVVRDPEGTASSRSAGLQGLEAAAKTGTAQAPGGSHAWICGYWPASEPRVAFAVLVEHVQDGRHGGGVAGPVAGAMLRAWREVEEAGEATAGAEGGS